MLLSKLNQQIEMLPLVNTGLFRGIHKIAVVPISKNDNLIEFGFDLNNASFVPLPTFAELTSAVLSVDGSLDNEEYAAQLYDAVSKSTRRLDNVSLTHSRNGKKTAPAHTLKMVAPTMSKSASGGYVQTGSSMIKCEVILDPALDTHQRQAMLNAFTSALDPTDQQLNNNAEGNIAVAICTDTAIL